MKTFLIAASLAAGLSVNAVAADSSEEKARYEVGNQKGQDGSQSGTMKQDQVQTRTRTSLQEGEGEQLIREQKRLQERSQTDQMHQMNQIQQMHRTKGTTNTQGKR